MSKQDIIDGRVRCFDCGRQYGDEHGFPDLIIPLDIWKRISPTGDEGGLLCPSCICARLCDAGISGVPAAFMSGPIDSIDRHAVQAYQMAENERLARERAERAKRGGSEDE